MPEKPRTLLLAGQRSLAIHFYDKPTYQPKCLEQQYFGSMKLYFVLAVAIESLMPPRKSIAGERMRSRPSGRMR